MASSVNDTQVACANCGRDFLVGLDRCPHCRATRDSLEPLEERQPQRVRSQEPPPPEVTLSWKSAWRIGVAVVVVGFIASLAVGVIALVILFVLGLAAVLAGL